MSWATHELENYFIQKHSPALRLSFLAIATGAFLPDLLTKGFVYGYGVGHFKIGGSDPIHFHRGWPGAGFTHSIMWGVLVSTLVLATTRSRAWALGMFVGHIAHIFTDINDTAGTMLFFPFSTAAVSTGMWKHAAVLGRYGDAAAYYSSPGGVWDTFWLGLVLIFARGTLTKEYFRTRIVPADPRVWAWIHRKWKIPERGLVAIYRGLLFYGGCRIVAWSLYARFQKHTPWDPSWGGPYFVQKISLNHGTWTHTIVSASVGAALTAGAMVLLWRLLVRRLWERASDPPAFVAAKARPAAA